MYSYFNFISLVVSPKLKVKVPLTLVRGKGRNFDFIDSGVEDLNNQHNFKVEDGEEFFQ